MPQPQAPHGRLFAQSIIRLRRTGMESDSSPIDTVRTWWKEGAKRGINLSPAQLRKRCKEEGMEPPSYQQLRSLRNHWVATAMFSEPRTRGRRSFATAQIFKLGTIFIGRSNTTTACRVLMISRLSNALQIWPNFYHVSPVTTEVPNISLSGSTR